jgi:hypothetical protein
MASEVLKQLDLAQCALGEDLLAEYIGDLLDGNSFVGLIVDGGTMRRKSTVSICRDTFSPWHGGVGCGIGWL